MTFITAIYVGFLVRRLNRLCPHWVMYSSHCGTGFIVTINAKPYYAATLPAVIRRALGDQERMTMFEDVRAEAKK